MATPTPVTVSGNVAPYGVIERIEFYPSQVVYHGTSGEVYVPNEQLVAAVEPDGDFSIALPSTDDPAWSPIDWPYKARMVGPDFVLRFDALVPISYVGTGMPFSVMLPAVSTGKLQLYAPYNHGNHVLVLGTGDPVPEDTPPNTVIFRT